MKRIFSVILAAVILIGGLILPTEVNAAGSGIKAGAVTTSGGSLNIRSGASTASTVVGTLKKGRYITLLERSGNWWKVSYGKDLQGYCHGDYITVVEGRPAVVATQYGLLNVRSGPGTSYTKTASLAKGESVLILSSTDGWCRILYHGTKTGYVSAQYIDEASSGYTAISLPVPNFKQNDVRWANVKIGSSGKTIGQIGCATTGIAMMESYRIGTTIYPDAMSKKLSYTSSGSVYWPSNFVAVTNSGDYLNRIYDQLKQGKPVLLGGKNRYGSQHWVVITGFSGGALQASNFTIRDPGSNSRVNLQQFLDVYPVFYKYFYYR